MVRLDKFTIKAQEAVAEAQELAASHGHQQIDPLHLLAALAAQKEGVVALSSASWACAFRSFKRKSRPN